MPKYLFKSSYRAEGVRGLVKHGGSARVQVAANLAADLGGSLESFYFAFGSPDAYIIAELPDNAAAAAWAMAVSGSGAVAVETVVLVSAEEMDAAAKKAPGYTPPRG